ncbi:MAG: beta-lactamase protein [uncultured bacterium]|nr:MAG: beta-lactamase protein [uncultured bacterium]HBG17749.1 hypothetical protein [Desulfobulbaceae bacterium]
MQTIERLGKLWLTEVVLGGFDVRAVLIPGKERVVVWDTLAHPDDMAAFLPMTRDRELVIVYSHADWDHIWGTAGLPDGNRTILAHDLCRERFSTEVPTTLAEKTAEYPDRWQAVQLIPPTTTFAREQAISLGESTLFLHHLPGHTPDSIVGFLPDEGVLLAGDAVETPLPQVPAECDLVEWIEELGRWQKDPRLRTVIPSHGAVGGPEILTQNIAYLRRLLKGEIMAIPTTLSTFYRETHLANVRAWCKGGQ